MSFFIDKHGRRKSPIALAACGAALLDLAVYFCTAALLAGPLYRTVSFGGETVTSMLHTIIITVAGMVGHVIVASWAAYPLAKDKFPGKALLFGMVVLSMMFNWTVTQIPQYAIISWLHINNTYLALILPAWSFGMGLYLMKQFMEQLPDSLMESARVQGANEWQIFWKIVMPNVKPAWLTLAIFQFQQMWGNTGSLFLRDEQLKPMQYALQQITAGGVSRAGAAAAVTFIIMAVPVLFFLLCQSSILETMTTSGMKD